MNILKHMEAVFLAALVLTVSTAYALEVRSQAPVTVNASAAPMAVVVVSAKRMSAEEKAQSQKNERQLAGARNPDSKRG